MREENAETSAIWEPNAAKHSDERAEDIGNMKEEGQQCRDSQTPAGEEPRGKQKLRKRQQDSEPKQAPAREELPERENLREMSVVQKLADCCQKQRSPDQSDD